MQFLFGRDQVLLFLGDVAAFVVALYLALLMRHLALPSLADLWAHAVPFSFLLILWLVVFVSVGLYDRHVALFERRLSATITEAQIVNFLLALAFFFVAPVAVQPKTVLALYFILSTALIVVWRLGVFRIFRGNRAEVPSLIVGTGPEIEELVRTVCETPKTGLTCAAFIDTATLGAQEVEKRIAEAAQLHNPSLLILDPRVDVRIPGIDVIEADDLYETLFNRVALGLLDRASFIRAATRRESRLYDLLKRAMDMLAALILGILSLIAYPFVSLAIFLEDRGTLFVVQQRVGQGGSLFGMQKFRSMTGDDSGQYGKDGKTKLRVTKVGNFLRKSRLDELPQLWSVLRGTQSLVGPRPELLPLVELYRKEIPHYDLRHLAAPGLSGWAQIYHDNHPHHGTAVEATKEKLAYDLYYIKHRSLILDLDIALKTMKTLVLRLGA
ncbi:MAG: sugar transferase [Patescibacteria group bacterium]